METIQKIPFFGIDRFYKKYSAEVSEIISTVYQTGQMMDGPSVAGFEKNIAAYCNRKHAITVNNCTDALYFSLKLAGIKEGDEILITGYSFIASVTPILMLNAIPVFVDIEPDYFSMDMNDLEKKITKKTKAILAVHLYGQAMPLDILETLSAKYNLILIEDGAQALGCSYKNKKVGSTGLLSCTSFDPTKIIGAFGTGGVLFTDDYEIYKEAKKLRYHGKNDKGQYEMLGYNSRINSAQAALLDFQLMKIEDIILQRRNVAELYNRYLKEIPRLETPKINPDGIATFHKYVIKTEKRDELKKYLGTQGIHTMIHYDKAMFENVLFEKFDYKAENIHRIHRIKNKVLSLPVYPGLTENEAGYICQKIKEFYSY
ncbi:MAG: DegT/DnrJ/EryC1/StrS family aminotransferase [Bacteroidia bacterium]|nr:DegT/DnrJ/EryC1/StrS family aminotransferase [Bacteroidia bacterium]